MVKALELAQLSIRSVVEEMKVSWASNPADPELQLNRELMVDGRLAAAEEITRLRELAKSPRIESWANAMRERSHRDAGGIAAVVKLLDLLRSMV